MSTDKVYYFRIGTRRIPFMYFKEGADGSEYVIFPMDRTGFKISKHPIADPHMKDAGGFYQRLDLSVLRSIKWDEIAKEWEPWWNSLFYWPSHRADLIAIPGPEGKSWFEGLQEAFGQGDMNLIALMKLALGGGTMYKISYGPRKLFFETTLGRNCAIIDPREQRFGAYVGGPYLGLPLLGLRWNEKRTFSALLPGPLQGWKETMDVRIETALDQYLDEAQSEMEAAMVEVLPEIEAFFENFKIVRWRPSESNPDPGGLSRNESPSTNRDRKGSASCTF